MNAQELIEAVSKRIRTSFEWWMSDEGRFPRAIERKGDGYLLAQSQTCWGAWAASARLAVDPALQSLISERDAALARVAELEKDAGRYRWLRNCDDSHGIVQRHLHTGNSWLPGGADLDAAIDAAISNAAPNVRDAGPTPYSGRTTRRDEG